MIEKKDKLYSLLCDIFYAAAITYLIVVADLFVLDFNYLIIRTLGNFFIILFCFEFVFDFQSLGNITRFIFIVKNEKIVLKKYILYMRKIINFITLPISLVLVLLNKKTIGDYVFKTDIKRIYVTNNNHKINDNIVYFTFFLLFVFNIFLMIITKINYYNLSVIFDGIFWLLVCYIIFRKFRMKIIEKIVLCIAISIVPDVIVNAPYIYNFKSNDSAYEFYIPNSKVLYKEDYDAVTLYLYEKKNKINLTDVSKKSLNMPISQVTIRNLSNNLKYIYNFQNGAIFFISNEADALNITNFYGKSATNVYSSDKNIYLLYLSEKNKLDSDLDLCEFSRRNNLDYIIKINDKEYVFDACRSDFTERIMEDNNA